MIPVFLMKTESSSVDAYSRGYIPIGQAARPRAGGVSRPCRRCTFVHIIFDLDYEWDAAKAAANLRKHGVDFTDAALSLEDPLARTMIDPDASGEERFVAIGADPVGRVLVTVYTQRGRRIRIISSRYANRAECRDYEEDR